MNEEMWLEAKVRVRQLLDEGGLTEGDVDELAAQSGYWPGLQARGQGYFEIVQEFFPQEDLEDLRAVAPEEVGAEEILAAPEHQLFAAYPADWPEERSMTLPDAARFLIGDLGDEAGWREPLAQET